MKKILSFLVIAFILSACGGNKGSNPTPGNTSKGPVITSLSVNTGPFGTVVNIDG